MSEDLLGVDYECDRHQLPPTYVLPLPKSLLTAAACSSKTSKQLYRQRFWRFGVVDLVVLACVLRATTEKGRPFFVLPQNIFF